MRKDRAAYRIPTKSGGYEWRRNVLLILVLLMSASTAMLYKYHIHAVFTTFKQVAIKYMHIQSGPDEQVVVLPVSYNLSNLESYGYIISNDFSGQQGSGVRALLSLQCWAASYALPMLIVEPYIETSSLSTKRKHTKIKYPMTFGDFFDLQHFNELSIGEGRPPMVSWRTFVANAPREAIVARIHGFNCRKFKEPFIRVVKEKQSEAAGSSCYPTRWLRNHQLVEANFCVVRVVQLWGCLSKPEAVKKMYTVIFGEWAPDQVTLVLRMWAATWDQLQNPSTTDSLTCRDKDGRNMQGRLHPSPRLLKEAEYYTSAFLNSQNRVAVMIRSEQAIRGFIPTSGDRLESLRVCLQKTAQLAKSLGNTTANGSGSLGNPAGIYLTLDVGSYGSKSVDWVFGLKKYNLTDRGSEVITMVKEFVPTLYDGKWEFKDWENSFTKATDEANTPGYIASLQRTIASQADCLVLMGGGDYQRLAMVDYMESHPDPSQLCLYFICFTNSYQEQYSNLVKETYNVTLNTTLHVI